MLNRSWGAVLVSVGLLSGCTHYPLINPAAFQPAPPKVAIAVFEAQPVRGGTMGVAMPIKDMASPYAAFRTKLASGLQVQLIDDAAVVATPAYAAIPPPLIDMPGTASPLKRFYVQGATAAQIAKQTGADMVLALDFDAYVTAGNQILGVGTAHVSAHTRLQGFAPSGELIWHDELTTTSVETFTTAAGVSDPTAVEAISSKAVEAACDEAIARLKAKLAEPPKS